MQDPIAEAVVREVANYAEVGEDEIKLEDRFEDLGVDSLDAIGIVADLEEEFGIQVPDESLRGLLTVGDAVVAVRGALDEAEAGS